MDIKFVKATKVAQSMFFMLLYFAIGAVLGKATAFYLGATATPLGQYRASLQFGSNASSLMVIFGAFGAAAGWYKAWCRKRCDNRFACMSCVDADEYCCKHYAMERQSLVFWTRALAFPSLVVLGFAAMYLWTVAPVLA